MAYYFTGGASDPTDEYISYGIHDELTANFDMSVGLWVKRLSTSVPDDLIMALSDFNFGPFVMRMIERVPNWGVGCYHAHGGFGLMGVECLPGLIDPLYAWRINQWLYFGFSRVYGGNSISSWFGNRNALVDGQVAVTGAPPPSVSPQEFLVGRSSSVELGPFSFWKGRVLLKGEHALLAKCQLPADTTGLELRTQMALGAIDIGPNHFTNTFHGSPTFIDETPCQPGGTGLDYAFHVA